MSGFSDFYWFGALNRADQGKDETVDAYAVLGVPPGADAGMIRAAYHRRVRELHPDRHLRDDGTVPPHVHEAFCQVTEAVEIALRAGAAGRRAPRYVPRQRAAAEVSGRQLPAGRAPVSSPVVPRQRTGAATPDPTTTQAPGTRPTGTQPRRPQRDPVALLRRLPMACAAPWTADELDFWHRQVVPRARQHLDAARTMADTAGPISGDDTLHATAHALLTCALSAVSGRRLHPIRLTSVYDLLEEQLPRTVVAGLPPRVVRLPRSRLLAPLLG